MEEKKDNAIKIKSQTNFRKRLNGNTVYYEMQKEGADWIRISKEEYEKFGINDEVTEDDYLWVFVEGVNVRAFAQEVFPNVDLNSASVYLTNFKAGTKELTYSELVKLKEIKEQFINKLLKPTAYYTIDELRKINKKVGKKKKVKTDQNSSETL